MKEEVSFEIAQQDHGQQEKLLVRVNSHHKSRQLSMKNIQADQADSKDIRLLRKSKHRDKTRGSLGFIGTKELLLFGESDYQSDHICLRDELANRCQYCGCTLKNPFFVDNINFNTINKPFSIYYVDYIRTFARKMECHQLPPSKQKYFLLFNYLPYLRQWSLFVMDRPHQQGLEELIFPYFTKTTGGSPRKEKIRQIEQAKKIPFILRMSYPLLKPTSEAEKRMIEQSERNRQQIENCDNPSGNGKEGKRSDSDTFNKAKDTYDFNSFTVLGNHESSNIGFCAVNQLESKCQILLRSDTNTKGCLHWFMFTVKISSLQSHGKVSVSGKKSQQVQQESQGGQDLEKEQENQGTQDELSFPEEEDNSETKKTIAFSILNNQRNGYLFREGMQIAVLDSSKPEKGWHRGGESIYYYKSNVDHQFFQQEDSSSLKQFVNSSELSDPMLISQIQPNTKLGFQTMDFSYTFSNVDQRVTFAYCFPYTLTDLVRFLENEEGKLISTQGETHKPQTDSKQKKLEIKTGTVLYRRKVIGCSRLGLPIILLKITSPMEVQVKKKVIFIIARQHPGETPASFVCQGLIQFLLSNSPEAQFLLNYYIFKIVPMMNPDGVVIGNSRCNLAGADLNRKWSCPDPMLHPEVFQVKNILKSTHEKREVLIFCDLHGHSTKKQSFFYGCNKATWGGASSWTQVRLLPRILARKCRFFNLSECHFRVTEDKKNTARVVAWRELKISNSFTLETSFFGYNDSLNEGKPTHFSTADLESIGKSLGESYFEYTLAMDALANELAANGGILKANIPYDSPKKQSAVQQQSKIPKGTNNNSSILDQQSFSLNMSPLLTSNTSSSQMTTSSILVSNIHGSQAPQIRASTPSKSLTTTNKDNNFNFKSKLIVVGSGKKQDTSNATENEVDFKQKQLPKISLDTKGGDWRDYFGKDELEKNFKKIARGEDPNELESVSGSDSEAEVDIFKEGELRMIANKRRRKKKMKTKKTKKDIAGQLRSSTVDLSKAIQIQPTIDKKRVTVSTISSSSGQPGVSLEKSKWNPSPFIKTYKLQMEMKKQQLAKKSYPIAKVGQNFQEQQQQQQQQQQSQLTEQQQLQQQQFNQIQQNPIIPWQSAPSSVQQKLSSVMLPQQQSASQSKNGINSAYLDKRISEIGTYISKNSNNANMLYQMNSVGQSGGTSNYGNAAVQFAQMFNRNTTQSIYSNSQIQMNKYQQQQNIPKKTEEYSRQGSFSDGSVNVIFRTSPVKRIKWLPQDSSNVREIISSGNGQSNYFYKNSQLLSRECNILGEKEGITETRERRDGVRDDCYSPRILLLKSDIESSESARIERRNLNGMIGQTKEQNRQKQQRKEEDQQKQDGCDNQQKNSSFSKSEDMKLQQDQGDNLNNNLQTEDDSSQIELQYKTEELLSQNKTRSLRYGGSLHELGLGTTNEFIQNNSTEDCFCLHQKQKIATRVVSQCNISSNLNKENESLGEIVDYSPNKYEQTQDRSESLKFKKIKSVNQTNNEQQNRSRNDKDEENKCCIAGEEDDGDDYEDIQDKIHDIKDISKHEQQQSPQKRFYCSLEDKEREDIDLSDGNSIKKIGNSNYFNQRILPNTSSQNKSKEICYQDISPISKKHSHQLPEFVQHRRNSNDCMNTEYQLSQRIDGNKKYLSNQKEFKGTDDLLFKGFQKINCQQVRISDSRDKTKRIASHNVEKKNGLTSIQDKIENILINQQQFIANSMAPNRKQYINSIQNSSYIRSSQEKIANSFVRNSLAAYQPTLKKLRARSIQESKPQLRSQAEKAATSSDEYTLQQYLQQETVMPSVLIHPRSKNFSQHTVGVGTGGGSSYLYGNPSKKLSIS